MSWLSSVTGTHVHHFKQSSCSPRQTARVQLGHIHNGFSSQASTAEGWPHAPPPEAVSCHISRRAGAMSGAAATDLKFPLSAVWFLKATWMLRLVKPLLYDLLLPRGIKRCYCCWWIRPVIGHCGTNGSQTASGMIRCVSPSPFLHVRVYAACLSVCYFCRCCPFSDTLSGPAGLLTSSYATNGAVWRP